MSQPGHFHIDTGNSRSFPDPTVLQAGASPALAAADIVIITGEGVAGWRERVHESDRHQAVLLELGDECLGVHTGESRGLEGSNVLGFARFRLGNSAPAPLVEVVRQPGSQPVAIAAAKAFFERLGLQVALCGDFSGRIVDRLVRPYFNAVLRRLDEGLASADDLDTTLKLGLGYPEGPVALLERTGLAAHCRVTQQLFDALGQEAYVPARRARIARARGES